MHTKTICTATVSERPSPSRPPGLLFAQAIPNRSRKIPTTPSSYLRVPAVPFRDHSWSAFTPKNPQIENLTLYAKLIPKKAHKGSQQPEDLRRIHHFSNSNLRIFEQFHTFHIKIMRIFEQNATFSPASDHWPLTTDHSNLTFHANQLSRTRAHSRTQLPNIRSSAGSATVQLALIPTPPLQPSTPFLPAQSGWLQANGKISIEKRLFFLSQTPKFGHSNGVPETGHICSHPFLLCRVPPWPPLAALHRSALPPPKNPNA